MNESQNLNLNLDGWTCPLPLRDYPNIVLGHGGGGKLSAELVQHLFLPAFQERHPAIIVGFGGAVPARAAVGLSTGPRSSCGPLFFPGGCIGDLAINAPSTTWR